MGKVSVQLLNAIDFRDRSSTAAYFQPKIHLEAYLQFVGKPLASRREKKQLHYNGNLIYSSPFLRSFERV